jgi:hypothetical protein
MKILAVIGFITVVFTVGMIVVMLFELTRAVIEYKLRRNIQKHRFEKPPTAKCYCIDCIHHSEDLYCDKFDGWCTADDWFCWDAEPSVAAKHSVEKGD